jgi:beta-lactam-binding protein with PASTA domain
MITTVAYSNIVPLGGTVSQQPAPNSIAPKGTKVTIIKSLGPKTVPAVGGATG